MADFPLVDFQGAAVLRQQEAQNAQREADRMELLEQRSQDRRDALADRQRAFLFDAIKSGASVEKLLGMVPDIPTHEVTTFKELERINKVKQKKAEAEQGLAPLAQLGALAKTPEQKAAFESGRSQIGAIEDPEAQQGLQSQLDVLIQQQKAVDAKNQATRLGEEARSNRMGLASSGRDAFVANAATIFANDPNEKTWQQIEADAVSQFGSNARGIILPQIRAAALAGIAQTEAALASEGKKEEAAARAFIDDGASPVLAKMALTGKAYRDPLSGVYARGGVTVQNKANLRAGAFEMLQRARVATEAFAKSGGGTAFTGTLEQAKRTLGPDADPVYAYMDTLRLQFSDIITRERTGAALNDQEITFYQSMLPSNAEIRFENGRIAPATLARFRALEQTLESQSIGPMDAVDRKRARASIKANAEALRGEFGADPLGTNGAPPPVTSEGVSLYQQLRGGAP